MIVQFFLDTKTVVSFGLEATYVSKETKTQVKLTFPFIKSKLQVSSLSPELSSNCIHAIARSKHANESEAKSRFVLTVINFIGYP